jgi:hypothetical protein
MLSLGRSHMSYLEEVKDRFAAEADDHQYPLSGSPIS